MPTRYTVSGAIGPYPVTLVEAKAYLKIDHGADDAVITLLIQAATQFAEDFTSRDFRTRTWIATLDSFDDQFLDRIQLRKNQIGAITSIQYFNDASTPVLTTVDAATYYLRFDQWWAFAVLKDSDDWPTDVDDEQSEQRITVTFTTVLPPDLAEVKVGILNAISAMYENRVDCGGCKTANDATSAAMQFAGPFLQYFRIPRI